MSDQWAEPGPTLSVLWRPGPTGRIPKPGDEVVLRDPDERRMRVVSVHSALEITPPIHGHPPGTAYVEDPQGRWIPEVLVVALRQPTAREIAIKEDEPHGWWPPPEPTPKPVDDPGDDRKVAFLRRMARSGDEQIAEHSRARLERMGLPAEEP